MNATHPHKVTLTHRTIGPAHDPYGQEALVVYKGDRTAELECCGLKGLTVTLCEGKKVVREWTCRNYYPATPEQVHADRLKAHLLFKRWVGVDPDDARDEFERGYDPRCDMCPGGN